MKLLVTTTIGVDGNTKNVGPTDGAVVVRVALYGKGSHVSQAIFRI